MGGAGGRMGEFEIMPFTDDRGGGTWFEVDGPKVADGKAETIVIQHGLDAGPGAWQYWADQLARNYRVVRRGMPQNELARLDSAASGWLERAAGDLAEFIQVSDLGTVHLVGIDHGALLALAVGARRLSCIRSILVCNVPTACDFAIRHASRRDFGLRLVDAPRPHLGPNLAGPSFPQASKLEAILLQIADPVLVIAPLKSELSSLDAQAQLAGSMPNASLLPVNGKEADIAGSRSEECIAAYLQFLAHVRNHHFSG